MAGRVAGLGGGLVAWAVVRWWRVLGARGWGELVKRRKLREWLVLGAVGGSVGGAALVAVVSFARYVAELF